MSFTYTLLTVTVFVGTVQAAAAAGDCYWTGCQPGTWKSHGCHSGEQEYARESCATLAGLRYTVAGFKYECCSSNSGTVWNRPDGPTPNGSGHEFVPYPFWPFNIPGTYYGNGAPWPLGYDHFVNYGRYKRSTN